MAKQSLTERREGELTVNTCAINSSMFYINSVYLKKKKNLKFLKLLWEEHLPLKTYWKN